jgi:hypothetical protein
VQFNKWVLTFQKKLLPPSTSYVPYIIANHLKTLTLVEAAVITTAKVTYAHVSMHVRIVHTRCDHTTKCSNPIALITNIPSCHLL